MMKCIGKKRSGDISPDLTSFSDIANLLIIFFILTTTLARPWGRQVDMPSSSKPPEQQQQSDTPTVNVLRDRLTVAEKDGGEGKELTMDEFRQYLYKRNFPSLDEQHRSVALETSPDVPYERYYQVVTAIAAAGGVVAILTD